MSEQLPPLVSHASLRIITAAAQVGEISNEVLSFLSASAEYHLLDVIHDASNFRARGKRSRLTVEDVNASLKLRGTEGSLVLSGGATKPQDDEVPGTGEGKVDLRKVANASLPVCPIEPGFHMHWLAVDGQQPLLPQNPIPSAGRGKGNSGKRGRENQADGDGAGAVRARLSEELTTYLRRCCDAILSRDEAKRGRALASLREDPGLQQLLPHLCTFIQSKVPEYLKRQKEPDQLAALLQMLQCLLNNKHFAFLEIYLDRLLPPLMSCLLHIDFERPNPGASGYLDKNGSAGGSTLSSALPPPKWTHWKVRDYAAELLRAICDKHGHTYPTLQARANDMFYTHISRPQTMLTTLYGSITGLACLGRMPVEQTLGPRVNNLAGKIARACEASSLKRDTKGVAEANMCRLALLRAMGSATLAGTDFVFGEPEKRSATGAREASRHKGDTMKGGGHGTETSSPKTGGATAAARAAGSSGNHGGGPGRASPGGQRRRRAASLRQRLDRSLYPSRKASGLAAAKAGAPAGVTPPRGAALEAGSGAGLPAKDLGGGGGIGVKRSAGAAEDGGPGALDEVIFPWYVVGLRRDGAPQGWWLTDKHHVFI